MSTAAAMDPGAGGQNGLIFRPERSRANARWRLILMLLLSLLAHAASFYVLQVAYIPTGSLLPPPAQVILIPPGSPESAALERWIDMLDPALMTQPRLRSADQVLGMIGFRYVPSYATLLQGFKPLPPAAVPAAPPKTRKAGPVPAGLLPPLHLRAEPLNPAGKPAAPTPQATRVVLSGGIADLRPENSAPLPKLATLAAKPLEPSVFLVGVPPAGGPAWIFQQGSSGDATDKGADAAARAYLSQLSFKAPGDDRAVWGWARFYWGREAYH